MKFEIPKARTEAEALDAGYDAAVNGPMTKAWERGNALGKSPN